MQFKYTSQRGQWFETHLRVEHTMQFKYKSKPVQWFQSHLLVEHTAQSAIMYGCHKGGTQLLWHLWSHLRFQVSRKLS